MGVLRASTLLILLVAVGISSQEDGKIAPSRFHISLTDIPFLGNLFAHQNATGKEKNETSIQKHLQVFPISVVTSGVLQNTTDIDFLLHSHTRPNPAPYAEGTQKLTADTPNVNRISLIPETDPKSQPKPVQKPAHFRPKKESTTNISPSPSSAVKPADITVPQISVIPIAINDFAQQIFHSPGSSHSTEGNPSSIPSEPSLTFQNPFATSEKPPHSSGVQGQGVSSVTINTSQAASGSMQYIPDSQWSQSFGIPSLPIVPQYPKPTVVPQNPNIPGQQAPANMPHNPFVPFDNQEGSQWQSTVQMPGTFGIPEGIINFPNFQYPVEFVQQPQNHSPATNGQESNNQPENIQPTKQPECPQQPVQNGGQNFDTEGQEVAPQTSQHIASFVQDHQIHHTYRPTYAQHQWQQASYGPYQQAIIQNTVPYIPQQNSVGASQQAHGSSQIQGSALHPNSQLQRFPLNYKRVYVPVPIPTFYYQ